jgi:isopenicillin N synthase-like dioxygenase
VLERLTNGVLRATPHRVALTEHPRNSIIRFTALHPDAIIAPLPQFVTSERPALYVLEPTPRHCVIPRNTRGSKSWPHSLDRALMFIHVCT